MLPQVAAASWPIDSFQQVAARAGQSAAHLDFHMHRPAAFRGGEETNMQRFAAALALGLTLAMSPAHAADPQPVLTGEIRIHDPSVIQLPGGSFVAFETGNEGGAGGAVRTKASPDGLRWTSTGTIGTGMPTWSGKVLGYRPRNIWAPSVSLHAGSYYLYYSLSSFGKNTSAIGLMTATSIDPAAPNKGWVDRGVVLQSVPSDNFNAIDPFRIDTADGRAFLSFGSFWDGIKLRELDPQSGKLIAADTPVVALASRQGAGIEAASIIEHAGKFYLFTSFDQCCKGVQSTYNIRVGRADAVTGPYLDRSGAPLLKGGGSLVLGTTGRFIGPGGQEAIHTTQGDMLAYHYYDGSNGGASKLQLSPLIWSADGWPELGPLPE
jgi:arabinan endo-1,5-alpha-L-arabinosidase